MLLALKLRAHITLLAPCCCGGALGEVLLLLRLLLKGRVLRLLLLHGISTRGCYKAPDRCVELCAITPAEHRRVSVNNSSSACACVHKGHSCSFCRMDSQTAVLEKGLEQGIQQCL